MKINISNERSQNVLKSFGDGTYISIRWFVSVVFYLPPVSFVQNTQCLFLLFLHILRKHHTALELYMPKRALVRKPHCWKQGTS